MSGASPTAWSTRLASWAACCKTCDGDGAPHRHRAAQTFACTDGGYAVRHRNCRRGSPGGLSRRGASGARAAPADLLMEIESWEAALDELNVSDLFGERPSWHSRRANLLVEGLRFPRQAGYVVAIGPTLRIGITMECDPCSRMENVVPGLEGALMPDWRGGVLGTVLEDGAIAVGDEIRIER
ncbi:MOSC domain-containing protein [Novosphingobium panipatense]|uniref:MOSC domain-containing protein n=1 Tax=Novosphingobium panipatense TaxID=428991 RepID=UPI0036173BA6